MARPKSRIKIGLDDDPTIGLNQAASLSGRGAGSSSPRDVQDVGVLRSEGVTTTTNVLNTRTPPQAFSSSEEGAPGPTDNPPIEFGGQGITPRERLAFETFPGGAFNLTDKATGKPAIGWVVLGGKILPASAITPEIFSKIMAISREQFGGEEIPFERPSTAFPTFPGGPTDQQGAERFEGVSGGKGLSSPLREGEAGLDPSLDPAHRARLAEFKTRHSDETFKNFEDEIRSLLTGLIGAGGVFLPTGKPNPNAVPLIDRVRTIISGIPNPTVTLTLSALVERTGMPESDFRDLIDSATGMITLEVGKFDVETQGGLASLFGGVENAFGLIDPRTGSFLVTPDITGTGEKAVIEPTGAALFETRDKLLDVLPGIEIAEAGRESSLAIQRAQIALDTFFALDAANRDQQRLEISKEGLAQAKELAEAKLEQTETLAGRAEEFTVTMAGIRANLDWDIAVNREAGINARFEKDAAFKAADLTLARDRLDQEREFEFKRIQLEERRSLLDVLALLGQFPQLKGIIQASGIFSGQVLGDIDLDALFSGTLEVGEVPNAQQFSQLTPAAQEALVNRIAGEKGISPQIIIQTIQRNAPLGVGRLR